VTTHHFLTHPRVRASDGSNAAATGLRITASREPALVDDAVGVAISGCEPGSPVVVQARVEVDNAIRVAVATFRASQTGTVDTSRDASLAGTYTGTDPFGLWWSGDPVAPSVIGIPSPVSATLTVESSGRTAQAAIERLTGAIPARPAPPAPPAQDDAPALAGTSAPAASPPDIPQSTR